MEEPKKGPRDISDLKARLGLKKGGAEAPAPSAAAPASIPQPGRPLPPPPGFQAPPAAPPDPKRDPFATTAPPPQAAAAYYYSQPLPGTDDGQPVAQINQPKKLGKLGVFAGVGVVGILVGFISGGSCSANQNYNLTIAQAGEIRAEVEAVAKTHTTINAKLTAVPPGASPEQKLTANMKVAEELGQLPDLDKPPTAAKIFHTNYFYLDDLAIDSLFNYYNDTIHLFALIKENAKKTAADKPAIENFLKSGAGRADKNYGVLLDVSGPISLAHFVELGAPVCQKEGQTDCNANELKGFKYRGDSGGEWSQKPVKGKPGETVIPLQHTPLFTTVAAGNPDVLAAKDFQRRTAEIQTLAARIFGEQKALLESLKRASEKPKRFTF